MDLMLKDACFPGTVIPREQFAGLDGEGLIDRIFFLTNGIMLSQLKAVSGIDGTTLQNWVKRGWLVNTVAKRYSKDQMARILIINMIRGTMHLEQIDALLRYINPVMDEASAPMIPEYKLYGYLSRILDRCRLKGGVDSEDLRLLIREELCSYVEPSDGAALRLERALQVILIAYFANLARASALSYFETIRTESHVEVQER